MRNATLIATALLILVGCTHPFEQEIAEIRDLQKTVKACSTGVAAIDSVQFMQMYNDVQHERDFMNINNQDTLQRDEAVFLANYFRYMKKRMARILKGRKRMVLDLESTADQLGTLAGAIEAKELDEKEWRAYLSTEEKHVQRDTTLGFEMIRDYAGITDRYNKEHQQVVEYVKVHRENADKAYEAAD